MLLISDIFKAQKSDLDFLIELGKEITTQDNLGTRKPLIFRIRDAETVECVEGIEDFKKISFDFGDVDTMEFDEDELEQMKEFIKSNYEFNDYDEVISEILGYCTDIEDIMVFCESYDVEFKILYFGKELIYKGEFLTRKAAKEHLEKYSYRFSQDARIYCDCAAENEEITKFTEVLERLYEMNKGCDAEYARTEV